MNIPWPQVPLGEVTTAQYGLSVAATDDGTVPILGMKNLRDGRLVFNGLVRVTLTPEETENYCIRAGDILFNRTNSFDLVGRHRANLCQAEKICTRLDTAFLLPLPTPARNRRSGV